MPYPFSHRCQIESPIEPIAEGTQVAIRVLIKPEGMERAVEAGLQVAEHRVDSAEFRQIIRVAATGDHAWMAATSRNHRAEAGQTIGEHRTSCTQTALSPGGNSL